MYYTEYDAQGNLKTSIIGDDKEVAEDAAGKAEAAK